MSITRHEIRKISDENRGQPIISQAVVHGNVAYFAGVTPDPIVGDIKIQTVQVLRRVDELLKLARTDKSHLLSVQVWIADMRLFEEHNSVWNQWVDPANPPARACLTTDFWRPGMLVEVMVVAALPWVGRAGKPAAVHRARLTTLGICRTAPNSRSKATIGGGHLRCKRACPLYPHKDIWRHSARSPAMLSAQTA
jgi:enamine deaminase RidA (YjgF/YER057c/UK114 family)